MRPLTGGARGIYWLDKPPELGLMVDYNHAKVIAEQGAVVGVSGTRDGIAIGPGIASANTFDVMEFTDGLNQISRAPCIDGNTHAGHLMWDWASAPPSPMSRSDAPDQQSARLIISSPESQSKV